jgi:hypothetical protein
MTVFVSLAIIVAPVFLFVGAVTVSSYRDWRQVIAANRAGTGSTTKNQHDRMGMIPRPTEGKPQ